jgi:ribonuclease VapC
VICVDSSALLAIVLLEPEAERCRDAMASDPDVIISAATVAEALIVAGRRGVGESMAQLLEVAGLRVIDLTKADALRAAEAYSVWGKGVHRAHLNYGDCFAYELASRHRCPLLFVGDDFSKTDVESVL